MARIPRDIFGFTILPVMLPETPAFPYVVNHYLFIKRHEARDPHESVERSLFIANVPVLTTEAHIKHLFKSQLQAGIIERVEFSDATSSTGAVSSKQLQKTGRKRKRITADDLESQLEAYKLPQILDESQHVLGSQCVAVFVDKPSSEAALKAVNRASRSKEPSLWGESIESQLPPTGLERYKEQYRSQYPSRNDLVNLVDDFMSSYNRMIDLRSRDQAKKRQIPDDEGFVTVTKGTRGMAKKEEADEMAAKQKQKNQGLENFYRFQMREKRKEQQEEMVKNFEEDKRRVEELKRRRGRIRVSSFAF